MVVNIFHIEPEPGAILPNVYWQREFVKMHAGEKQKDDPQDRLRLNLLVAGRRVGLVDHEPTGWHPWVSVNFEGYWLDTCSSLEIAKDKVLQCVNLPAYDPVMLSEELAERAAMWGMEP